METKPDCRSCVYYLEWMDEWLWCRLGKCRVRVTRAPVGCDGYSPRTITTDDTPASQDASTPAQ